MIKTTAPAILGREERLLLREVNVVICETMLAAARDERNPQRVRDRAARLAQRALLVLHNLGLDQASITNGQFRVRIDLPKEKK